MKKIFTLVSLLVLVTACNQPSTNKGPEPTATATPEATPTPKMAEDETTIREKAAWEAIKKKDYDGFGNMLTSDQLYVSSDGVHDKAASINGLKGFEPTELTFSDWKIIPVDKDVVVVTYSINVKGNQNGTPMTPETVRASSAWVNRDGKWLSIYHQDSQVKAPTPTPTPTPSARPGQPAKTATPDPRSGVKTAVVPGSDPIANEKMIWDALQRKDNDAFAAFLATDSVEVEPEAVYDKAGSVKTVSSADFSRAVLSEWKALKLNDNAMLVTYLVRLPGPPKLVESSGGRITLSFSMVEERHTTIWVNRGGKWLALFHQGTTVKPPEPKVTPGVVATPTPKKRGM